MLAFIRFIKLDIWTQRICLLGAFLLIGKLLFLLFSDISIHAIEDWYIDQNLSDGKGYILHQQNTALKTPIYPIFLTFFALLPDITGKLLASATQHILFYIADLLLMWTVPLSIVYALLIIQYQQEHSKVNNWIRYMIGWIIALCQPILFPLICMSMMIKRKSDTYTILILPIIITFLIVFSPWIYRNTLVFDSIVVFKTPFWMNIYEGFYPSPGISSKYISIENQKSIDSLRQINNDFEMEKYYKPIVMNAISDYPKEYVLLSIDRFKQFWTIPHRYDDRIFSLPIIISRLIPQFLLSIGVVISTILLSKQFQKNNYSIVYFHVFLLFSVLYVSIIYSLTQSSNIRFKLDIEWIELLLLYPLFEYISEDILKKKNTRLN